MSRPSDRHLNDESLVAHLDGELSPWAERGAVRHLKACWHCRTRLAQLNEEIQWLSEVHVARTFPGPHRIDDARREFSRKYDRLVTKVLTERSPKSSDTIASRVRLLPKLSFGAAFIVCCALATIALGSTAVWRYFKEKPVRVERASLPIVPSSPTVQVEPAFVNREPRTVRKDRVSTTPPEPVDLDALELNVRHALHSLRACLGEPIEIRRAPRGIQVHGLVESPARKLELLERLGGISRVQASIETATTAAGEYLVVLPSEDRYSQPAMHVSAGPLPIQIELERYFTKQKSESGSDVHREIAALSNEVVRLSDASLAEAWALKRLADRYPQIAIASLTPRSRHLLRAMVQDHIDALRGQCERLRTLLEPILFSMADASVPLQPRAHSQSEDWNTISASLVHSVRQMDRLIQALFGGAETQDHPAGVTVSGFMALLAQVHAGTLDLDAVLASGG